MNEFNQKQIEKLNCIRNEMTHLWGSVFILGGGSISLVLNSDSFKEYFVSIIGAFTAIIFIRAYFMKRDETLRIIKTLGEKQ